MKPPVNCDRCGGIGKLPCGVCNCGSGEGCSIHDDRAISMWGEKCPKCKGTGIMPKKPRKK